MKTEAEIRRAIELLEALPPPGNIPMKPYLATLDCLRWCIGDDSRFEKMVRELGKLHAAVTKRIAESN